MKKLVQEKGGQVSITSQKSVDNTGMKYALTMWYQQSVQFWHWLWSATFLSNRTEHLSECADR